MLFHDILNLVRFLENLQKELTERCETISQETLEPHYLPSRNDVLTALQQVQELNQKTAKVAEKLRDFFYIVRR